jgi:hypothetical protein
MLDDPLMAEDGPESAGFGITITLPDAPMFMILYILDVLFLFAEVSVGRVIVAPGVQVQPASAAHATAPSSVKLSQLAVPEQLEPKLPEQLPVL